MTQPFLSLSIWWYLKWNSNQTFYVFLNMQFVSFCTVFSSQFVVSSFRRTGMKMVQRYFAPVECVKSSTSPLTRCHVLALSPLCQSTTEENMTYHVSTIDCTGHLDFPVVFSPLTKGLGAFCCCSSTAVIRVEQHLLITSSEGHWRW